MPHISKRRKAFTAKVDRSKSYPAAEALKLVKETATAKFDEAIDVAVNLGIDAKKGDQTVRGSVVLPAGTGKKVRVAVFAPGDKGAAAKAAGADIVGMEDLAEQVKAGKMDFDVVIAAPEAMRVVGGLGQILGPRGLMPNPKSGTVTFDVAKAVRDAKGGRVEFRVDKTAVIHTIVGKASFSEQALVENLATVIDAINRARPAGVKGQYVRAAHLTSTHGPSVKLDLGATLGLSGRATA